MKPSTKTIHNAAEFKNMIFEVAQEILDEDDSFLYRDYNSCPDSEAKSTAMIVVDDYVEFKGDIEIYQMFHEVLQEVIDQASLMKLKEEIEEVMNRNRTTMSDEALERLWEQTKQA